MTRSQVRAACRRMRDHVEEIEDEAGELNLVPYMDIVTNIIIFLLASVVNQVALGNINVTVPTISSGSGSSADQPPPEKPPLNLTISVGATGFTVAASGGYYIACASDRIFCEPNTITGSIGVFGLLPNIKDFANNWGVTFDSVSTSKLCSGVQRAAFQVSAPSYRLLVSIARRTW